eukprot:COSAG02_NODE_174_length_31243_cov_76.084543_5_plen_135_part_00
MVKTRAKSPSGFETNQQVTCKFSWDACGGAVFTLHNDSILFDYSPGLASIIRHVPVAKKAMLGCRDAIQTGGDSCRNSAQTGTGVDRRIIHRDLRSTVWNQIRTGMSLSQGSVSTVRTPEGAQLVPAMLSLQRL